MAVHVICFYFPKELWEAYSNHFLSEVSSAYLLYYLRFVLFLMSQSAIFQLCRDGSSWVEPVLGKD